MSTFLVLYVQALYKGTFCPRQPTPENRSCYTHRMLKVLIVEDSPERLPALKHYINSYVNHGHPAATFDHSLMVIDPTGYDVVMLDHDLGAENAYQQLRYGDMAEKFAGVKLVIVHSMNPVGANNIKNELKGICKVHHVPFSSIRDMHLKFSPT